MTGDESYHAHCFTCRTCKKRIEELVFAKTTQGIYCMACHNERVAKSRRHAEARRQRAAKKEREREDLQRREEETVRQQAASPLPSPVATLRPSQTSPLPNGSPSGASSSSVASPRLANTASPEPPDHSHVLPAEIASRTHDLQLSTNRERSASPASRQRPENLPLPASPADGTFGSQIPGHSRSQTAPTGQTPGASQSRTNPNIGLGMGPVGLNVPTSKQDRRKSINPGLSFNIDPVNGTFTSENRLSPHPPSPLREAFTALAIGELGPRSPSSPTPSNHAGDGFPFQKLTLSNVAAPLQTDSLSNLPKRAAQDYTSEPPPRKSSLAEQGKRSDVENEPIHERYEQIKSSPQDEQSVSLNDHDEIRTPRILEPNLSPVTFSLSDPDFADLLQRIDRGTPDKTDVYGHISHSTDGPISPSSDPASPRKASPTVDRSPQMDLLGVTDISGVRSADQSPARTRLSPLDGAPVVRRQPSSESTASITVGGEMAAFALLQSIVAKSKQEGLENAAVPVATLVGLVDEMEEVRQALLGLQNKYSGVKRTSQQYSEGLTVAGEEYDKELAIRRDLEAEVTRLRAQVHSQTARLSVISGDERRQESLKRRSQDLASSLTGLERDISRLRAQRDVALAEVEELHATKQSSLEGDDGGSALSRSIASRLETIREQYREELEPLTAQREALQREITDLKDSREQILEESAALAAKNEELAELNAQLTRQTEIMQDQLARQRPTIFSKGRGHPAHSPSMSSLATTAGLQDVPEETARVLKVEKAGPLDSVPKTRFKWYKSSKGPDLSASSASISRPLGLQTSNMRNMQRPTTEFIGPREHAFHQYSTMRLTRCELCQEKMWGLQEVRCTSCGIICHSKCASQLPRACMGKKDGLSDVHEGPLPPSMFGRELFDQAVSDHVAVPVIVTKCIAAVEAVGMEYEGIYRKTGGSGQSKQITQLFERGDYDAFDLADLDAFNDISSVTSVLKTYFRQLPDPLLTFKLHETFVAAAMIKDAPLRLQAFTATLKEMPREHYNTLRELMLHLNRVTGLSGTNLMTSQNLGVVFGREYLASLIKADAYGRSNVDALFRSQPRVWRYGGEGHGGTAHDRARPGPLQGGKGVEA